MKITEIYTQFNILPNLQLHMLRVAAVASFICDNFSGSKIDKPSIITAALLHDMGNLVKFNLTDYPELLGDRPLTYWEGVQVEFRDRFGEDEYMATEVIIEEIGVSERVKDLVQATSYYQGENNLGTNDFGKKICAYSDLRVGLHGIISLNERLADFTKRYGHLFSSPEEEVASKVAHDQFRQLEAQLFDQVKISPAEITNQAVSDTIDTLKNFVIQTKK